MARSLRGFLQRCGHGAVARATHDGRTSNLHGAKHAGRAGKIGAAGLAALGGGGTLGVLGEPITYRVLYPRTFDPAKAPIVSAAIVLSALMSIFGTSRLRALRSGDAFFTVFQYRSDTTGSAIWCNTQQSAVEKAAW